MIYKVDLRGMMEKRERKLFSPPELHLRLLFMENFFCAARKDKYLIINFPLLHSPSFGVTVVGCLETKSGRKGLRDIEVIFNYCRNESVVHCSERVQRSSSEDVNSGRLLSQDHDEPAGNTYL